MIKWIFQAGLCLAFATSSLLHAETSPREYVVELSASVSADPPSIELQWPPSSLSISYEVSRSTPAGWQVMATLGFDAASFRDSSVQRHQPYEYRVRRVTTRGFSAFGYLKGGIALPAVEQHGSILLVLEQSMASAL